MGMLDDLLAQLRALFGGSQPAAGMVGPGQVTVDGVTFEALEPIREDWEASLEFRLLVPPGKIGYDPSNAALGGVRLLATDGTLPALRSKAGYPLQYGLEPGPSGTTRVSLRLLPRVKFADTTFANDREVEAFKAKRRPRP